MDKNKIVPKATLERYPVYLKALRHLRDLGMERVMSRELADYTGIEPTTIRRDFSFIGSLGKQGYGYDIVSLIEIFNTELGLNIDEKIILVEKMPEDCRIAILAISTDVQKTVDKLVECGILGIVDFTHEHIMVPKSIIVKSVDVVSTIQEMVFETNKRKRL
jgi:AT-rich DNA-binding protein